MAKNEDARPRSKRTKKVNEMIAEEAIETAGSVDTEQSSPSPNDQETAELDGSEILELPVLPLRGTVVLVMQKDAELEGAGPDDVYDIGTISTIHQMMRVPDGTVRLAVQGNERMRVIEFLSEEPYLVARVQRVPEQIEESVEVDALTRNTLELFQRLVSLVAHMPDELVTAALNVDDPRHLVYLVATNLRIDPEVRQQLLELDSVRDKLAALNSYIAKELDVLELGKKIQSDVQQELGKNQRDFYLRE